MDVVISKNFIKLIIKKYEKEMKVNIRYKTHKFVDSYHSNIICGFTNSGKNVEEYLKDKISEYEYLSQYCDRVQAIKDTLNKNKGCGSLHLSNFLKFSVPFFIKQCMESDYAFNIYLEETDKLNQVCHDYGNFGEVIIDTSVKSEIDDKYYKLNREGVNLFAYIIFSIEHYDDIDL